MTPEQAAERICWKVLFSNDDEAFKDVLDIIHAQRAEAVAEYREQILSIIDSQTHTSDLGDAYRHIRQLINGVPAPQEGEG